MNYLLDKIKEYVNYLLYNVKNVFSLNLNEIIESEYKKAFEILDKLGIIEYIKREYKIDYKIPELEISKDNPKFFGEYSKSENKITISKKSIKRKINNELKSLGYKEIKDLKYLNISYNSIFLYPFYINDKNIRKSIVEAFIILTMFHEIWHSIDYSILNRLEEDPNIKDRDYLLIILNSFDNPELRASAFEVVMYYYYLVNNLYKDKKGYITPYPNILACRNYIEKIDILEKNEYMKRTVPYDLGFCYANIIVAAYKSSLEKNIYRIIDNIIYLDKEIAVKVIKHYRDNLDKLLYG